MTGLLEWSDGCSEQGRVEVQECGRKSERQHERDMIKFEGLGLQQGPWHSPCSPQPVQSPWLE